MTQTEQRIQKRVNELSRLWDLEYRKNISTPRYFQDYSKQDRLQVRIGRLECWIENLTA